MIPNGEQPVRWPHPIAAVAFDMDGLLINTEELYFEVFDELMQRRGKHYTHALRRSMMGLPSPQAYEVLIRDAGLSDTADELEEESDEIFSGVLPDRLATMPGVLELLQLIEGLGLPLCVATSSRRSFAIDSLTAVGVLERFGFVITAEEVARGKPFPDIYLEAAKRMHVPPQQMVVFEDSQHGTRASLAAGACTIAVPGDHSRDHDFTGVFCVADTLADPAIKQLLITAGVRA
jgi:HAD superfamily hydrolase (TIGR01509 family)